MRLDVRLGVFLAKCNKNIVNLILKKIDSFFTTHVFFLHNCNESHWERKHWHQVSQKFVISYIFSTRIMIACDIFWQISVYLVTCLMFDLVVINCPVYTFSNFQLVRFATKVNVGNCTFAYNNRVSDVVSV